MKVYDCYLKMEDIILQKKNLEFLIGKQKNSA